MRTVRELETIRRIEILELKNTITKSNIFDDFSSSLDTVEKRISVPDDRLEETSK